MNNYDRQRYEQKYRPDYDALMKCYLFELDDLPGEIWLPVPDYEDYHVSNFGRVKSFKFKTPRIMIPYLNGSGYLQICLSKDDKSKHFHIHRLVALCFVSNPQDKPEVNHIDGNKLNNFVENLEWVTREQNINHAFDIGIAPQGQDRPEAKLTNEQARFIRENPDDLNSAQLAELFGVCDATIGRIRLGRTYKTAGGSIRQGKPQKYTPRIPDEVRNQIRAEYVRGSKEFGTEALSRKYGYTSKTIWNIVNKRR